MMMVSGWTWSVLASSAQWEAFDCGNTHHPATNNCAFRVGDESTERFELGGVLRFETNPQMPTCQAARWQGLVYKTFAEPKPAWFWPLGVNA
jgi:hypothetical protein